MTELFQIAQRLIKWDTDFPVNCHNGYVGLKELDRIIADAKVALTKAGLPCVDELGTPAPEANAQGGVREAGLFPSSPDLVADQTSRQVADPSTVSYAGSHAPATEVHVPEAEAFDKADFFWRTMDPDDCGYSPEEALNRGMIGRFCVCEVGSSYTGPTRYGFIAPVLDPESDDEEFLHFATQEEAIAAAKERQAATEAMEASAE
ncbi:hypothetical protein [Sinorhizobium sp. CCBAU 05631]|uniref:hypothetical protein n=1 Tax=Sinorhizobium sp. CCBAU 05631 TaxID=794846 RepID=UPI000567B892|nr:hypothetical protein [Sinorhizobium sp. CCBAU 05631]ASY56452.1 hypothetical protein SS05631_c15160 [Sinorhizobium sp. CCBAU 05631]